MEQQYKELLSVKELGSGEVLDLGPVIARTAKPDNCIFQLEEMIRVNATLLSRLIEDIKTWFYIALPPSQGIEKVQEEMDQVLSTIGAAVKQVIEQLLYYHSTRGKLVVKLQKLRLFDVAKMLLQFDITQINVIKNNFTDLFNALIIAYDTAVKSYEDLRDADARRQRPAEHTQGFVI